LIRQRNENPLPAEHRRARYYMRGRYLPRGSEEEKALETRLQNWGNWSLQNARPRLGYPSTAAGFAKTASKGTLIAENDAQWIEDIIVMLLLNEGFNDKYPMYAFIMLLDYAKQPMHSVSHVSHRARQVRDIFDCRCAESTYYKHADRAKAIIAEFACEIH
jgi:hypothetical protein